MLLGLPKRARDVGLQLGEGDLGRSGPRHNKQTKPAPGERGMQNRRDTAANSIADHGFADRLSDRNPRDCQAVGGQRIGTIDGKDPTWDPPAARTQTGKVRAAPQAGILAHQTVRR